jgi:hypothetical protein
MIRRVVAKVEFHCGELFPRVGFMVTNLGTSSRAVVRFYVNAELNCHFFADADVPHLTNSLFIAPDTIAGCTGKLRSAWPGRFR